MTVKIGRGGWVMIFLGTGLVAYGLNRYGLGNLVRWVSRLGQLSSARGRPNYIETSVSNKPRTEFIAEAVPAFAKEAPFDRRSDKIRRRAEQLYLQRGSHSGSALDDWLRAEAEVRQAEDAAIDEASEESFPASDAPAY